MLKNISPHFRILINIFWHMHLLLAAIFLFHNRKPNNILVTTRVSSHIRSIWKFLLFWMFWAMINLCKSEVIATHCTLINYCSCPHFPKYSTPWNLIWLQIGNESLCIPIFVLFVLCDFSSKFIDMDYVLLWIWAPHPTCLLVCVNMITVHASIESVCFDIDQILKLVHEDFWLKAISGIFKIIQNLESNLVWNQSHRFRRNIAHVKGHFDHIIQITCDISCAVNNQLFHLQKVCRNQNRDDIVYGDLRLFCFDVLHQPFEDVDVALDTYVNVFCWICSI